MSFTEKLQHSVEAKIQIWTHWSWGYLLYWLSKKGEGAANAPVIYSDFMGLLDGPRADRGHWE